MGWKCSIASGGSPGSSWLPVLDDARVPAAMTGYGEEPTDQIVRSASPPLRLQWAFHANHAFPCTKYQARIGDIILLRCIPACTGERVPENTVGWDDVVAHNANHFSFLLLLNFNDEERRSIRMIKKWYVIPWFFLITISLLFLHIFTRFRYFFFFFLFCFFHRRKHSMWLYIDW